MKECPKCHVAGYIITHRPPKKVVCPMCDGRGYIDYAFFRPKYRLILEIEKKGKVLI